jgi:hypothetical protein
MTHRGSGIWSYTGIISCRRIPPLLLRNANASHSPFLRAGAILLVRVPATIMISLCLGLARKTTPSRSWSYRAAAMCLRDASVNPITQAELLFELTHIISTAQQARPNVMGHMEP